MKTYKHTLAIISMAFLATLSTASAHIGYTGRDFGIFSVTGSEAPVLINSNTTRSNYGWARGTDATPGDSHNLRAFKLTLLNTGLVTLEIQGLDIIRSGVSVRALAHPGFSIFKGLAASGSHDASDASEVYNNAAYGVGNWEGSFRALSDWAVGVDGAPADFPLSYFTYVGNAADGSSLNYGDASGVNGDGIADGYVRGSLVLGPGDYSLFVGGGDISGTSASNFAFNTTLSVAVIPEPSTYALFGLGALLITFAYRRRVASETQVTL